MPKNNAQFAMIIAEKETTILEVVDMTDLEELQKALEQLKPKLTRVTMTGSYQEGYLDAVHDVKELFSVFQKDNVIIPRKQLEERALEIDNPSNDYGEVCKQNRQYRCLLKELLAGSDLLSPEEIKDVEASEKEFAEGKCKTFENTEDLIAELQKGRKKGSVGVEK